VIQRTEGVISVDARPSDSIAVALRAEARIFAEDELLEMATVEISEEGGEALQDDSRETLAGPSVPFTNPEELKEYLRRMHPEDFGRFSP
jgi:bifunctional DNase/RNase